MEDLEIFWFEMHDMCVSNQKPKSDSSPCLTNVVETVTLAENEINTPTFNQ